jgi:hypothetical protein
MTPRPATIARLGAIVAGAALICGGVVLSLAPGAPGDDRPTVHATAVIPALVPTGSADTAPASTGLFEVPSVGLSASLLSMEVPASGEINPATNWAAYLVTGYGIPADPGSGTVFAALHSGRGTSHALGDLLVDRVTGRPAVAIGALIVVDGVRFEVTDTRVVTKGSLKDEADLWDGSNGIVLLTCAQYADARPSQNAVILGKRL